MKNERDIQFTPGTDAGMQDVTFTPSQGTDTPATGRTTGSTAAGTGGQGTGYNASGQNTGTTSGQNTGYNTSGQSSGYQGSGHMGGQGMQGQGTQDSGQGGGGLRDTAQQMVSSVTERAASQVTSRLDDQKMRAADTLTNVAETLRNSSRQFEGVPDGLTRYIDQAADRVEDIAHYLHDREVTEIVDQVEDFARRQPAAFLGGAFALGVLGARFLKSSRSNLVRYEVRDRWDRESMTNRMQDPERDAVGRPMAPGYAPPSERSSSEHKAAGPRE